MSKTGPKARYLDEIDQGIIWRDELQAQVVDEFQRLYNDLTKPAKKRWFFQADPTTPQGIYIYGSVGRGKTHLMDLFYDSLPEHVGKMRQHYHEFMLWLHGELRANKNIKNPLSTVCKQLAKHTQVLCLDEFLVNDIANAMLLAGLLKAFTAVGIALVTTSNVEPDNLYKDGLQRAQFLPAISWINHHMQVLHLDGDEDYRQQGAAQHENWYFPINNSSTMHMQQCFDELSNHENNPINSNPWTINDRQLSIIKAAERILWCNFKALCEQARNAADYLVIAKKIDTLFISDIPNMSADNDNAARRFITLIDVMYEAEVKIIAQGASHYKMIYHGEKMAFEFERAASRLAQMLV